MLVYLVRHGIAAPADAPGVIDDASRPLTPQGGRRMHRAAAGLAHLRIRPAEIWTSPLLRARQTADLLGEALDLSTRIVTMPCLEPGSRPEAVLQQLITRPDLPGVALVGHEPLLGELATFLLTGLAAGSIRFKKGGAACIEVEDVRTPVRGRLLWLLTPGQLRGLAGAT